MIAHNRLLARYFTTSLKSTTSTRASGVTRMRVEIQILEFLLIHRARGCRLLEKTASLIADLDLKILVEASASWRNERAGYSKNPWRC